jgi:anthranilate phosphoribosyltransferase
MSSKCGSADVLEALGVKLELTAQQAASCLEKAGICFMFAPVFHPAMRYAVAPRREIGIRTVFNILGPLTNPAGAEIYLLGVAAESLLEKMALVLQRLNCRNAMIVHSTDGLDEITLSGNTMVRELKNGHISSYIIGPTDFGLTYNCSLEDLRGGTVEENAMLLRSILNGQEGPYLDAALMNAAAALFVGQKVSSLKHGFNLAQRVIDNGQALETLQLLIDTSHSMG